MELIDCVELHALLILTGRNVAIMPQTKDSTDTGSASCTVVDPGQPQSTYIPDITGVAWSPSLFGPIMFNEVRQRYSVRLGEQSYRGHPASGRVQPILPGQEFRF